MPADQDTRPLGRTGIHVLPLGIGTNKWRRAGRGAVLETYRTIHDAGPCMIDTAEFYFSERVVGDCLRAGPTRAVIASKFVSPCVRPPHAAVGQHRHESAAEVSRRYCPRARCQHQPGRPELADGARQSRDSHPRRDQALSRQGQYRCTRLAPERDRVRRDRPSLSKEWNMNPVPFVHSALAMTRR
jgi:hypothetical protein